MAYDWNQKIVIGVSSRALFDLTAENEIFEKEGVEAYCCYQIEHENHVLKKGPGFALIEALLKINELPGQQERIEVIIMSHNSPDTSLRIFNSIKHYGLNISRAALVSGAALAPYLAAFKTDLFLSADEEEVQRAIDSGVAAGIICNNAECDYDSTREVEQIRIAFDGDAVLFNEDSEQIFKELGLKAFEENETVNARNPLPEGPFARFLQSISELQKEFPPMEAPIRTALVTSRSAPAHERVIRTLRAWNVRIDEAFFLGGLSKTEILRAFGAYIFFDDQAVHTAMACKVVPSARVPYKKRKRVMYEVQSNSAGSLSGAS